MTEPINSRVVGQPEVIVASFVYLTANRDEMMPRIPLPKMRPKRTNPF